MYINQKPISYITQMVQYYDYIHEATSWQTFLCKKCHRTSKFRKLTLLHY